MKKLGLVLAAGLVIPAAAVLAANKAHKAEPKEPAAEKTPAEETVKSEIVTITGSVTCIKNAKGQVDKVQIKSENGTVYDVTPGSESKMLALSAGKTVEAIGTVNENKDSKVLLIRSFKVMQ